MAKSSPVHRRIYRNQCFYFFHNFSLFFINSFFPQKFQNNYLPSVFTKYFSINIPKIILKANSTSRAALSPAFFSSSGHLQQSPMADLPLPYCSTPHAESRDTLRWPKPSPEMPQTTIYRLRFRRDQFFGQLTETPLNPHQTLPNSPELLPIIQRTKALYP